MVGPDDPAAERLARIKIVEQAERESRTFFTNEKLDVEAVKAKFGVPPERIVDYLTLVGDSVDNIPGVEKGLQSVVGAGVVAGFPASSPARAK